MFQEQYRKKLCTPREAAATLKDGDKIIHGLTMAEPPGLLGAIADRVRAGELHGLVVYSLLPLATAGKSLLAPELCDQVEGYTWFVAAADRGLVSVGLNQFMPNHLHQVPRLIRDHLELDLCVTTVSPMDKAGYFSFGTANDYTSTAARHAKRLIVEVNRNMPRVFGQSLLHISEVDMLVENHVTMLEMAPAGMSEEDKIIGAAIAEMVPDGACIQLGVGSLPNAVASFLTSHKDLGIHTEVFGPGMVDLIKKGVVTGKRKTLLPNKHVYTVAQGDKAMLEFMDDNPAMASYPVDFTNDPCVIAQNDDMISINSIIEVDLLGQCNSEFLAGHQFSGTGGQLDFVRGAYAAKGGKSILAFHSTAKGGAISRIVPRLASGTMVTTPRMDTQWLATEYGAVNLKGKCTRDRALAIIDLAHPDFREGLLREAEAMYLL